MTRVRRITVCASSLAVVVGLAIARPGPEPQVEVQSVVHADDDRILVLDVACDCRTGSPFFFTESRGEAWIVSGKIFPAGSLPAGEATNDPTLPVGGVAPIGEWTCRGQGAFPFPEEISGAYGATPFAFNTQYFILNDGRALTVEGYAFLGVEGSPEERLSVTGGIGRYSGASGDVKERPFGTNVTGCPNFRARFKLASRSRD